MVWPPVVRHPTLSWISAISFLKLKNRFAWLLLINQHNYINIVLVKQVKPFCASVHSWEVGWGGSSVSSGRRNDPEVTVCRQAGSQSNTGAWASSVRMLSVCLPRDSQPGPGWGFFPEGGSQPFVRRGELCLPRGNQLPIKATEKLPSKPAPQARRRAQ